MRRATATIGGCLVQDAELRFLFGHGQLGENVDQVQTPVPAETIAVFVGLGKVVAGVEEDDRHIADGLADQVDHDHVFGLEAAGYADFLFLG